MNCLRRVPELSVQTAGEIGSRLLVDQEPLFLCGDAQRSAHYFPYC